MKTYETRCDIAARPGDVWHALTKSLAENPIPFGILRMEGQLRQGSKIRIWSEVSPNRAFTLRVIQFDQSNVMVWQGGMPFGLFTGTRTFTMEAVGDETRFTVKEDFTGSLSGLITKSMPDLTDSFTKFAHALKMEAER